jgi:hypothetical protein
MLVLVGVDQQTIARTQVPLLGDRTGEACGGALIATVSPARNPHPSRSNRATRPASSPSVVAASSRRSPVLSS